MSTHQARREKINARMELLKELVPGCSKVRLPCLHFFTPLIFARPTFNFSPEHRLWKEA